MEGLQAGLTGGTYVSALSHQFSLKFGGRIKESSKSIKIIALVAVLLIVALLGMRIIDARREAAFKSSYSDGMDAFKRGNISDAVMRLEKAVHLNPDDSNAHLNLARGYTSTGKLDGAEKEYLASLSINNNQPEAYFNLGVIYKSRREVDKAIESFKKAKELDKGMYPADIMRASLYRETGKPAEAIAILTQIIKDNPFGANLSDLYVELGMAYKVQGNDDVAKQQWQEALKINKDNPNAKRLLGIQ